MNNTAFVRRIMALTTAAAVTVSLSGCAALGRQLNGTPAGKTASGEQVSVSETVKPKFEPKKIEPIVAKEPSEPVKDDGLGVEWTLISVDQGPTGGAQFHVKMKNLNEQFAVPSSAVGDPTLKVGGKDVARMQVDGDGMDLPLGPMAQNEVTYTFNTNPWSLTNGEFRIGNAVFKGYLNL